MKTENARFMHCPKCDHKLLTVDVTSTEKPPKYLQCSNCLESPLPHEWVIKRYPHTVKPKAPFKSRKFRGYRNVGNTGSY